MRETNKKNTTSSNFIPDCLTYLYYMRCSLLFLVYITQIYIFLSVDRMFLGHRKKGWIYKRLSEYNKTKLRSLYNLIKFRLFSPRFLYQCLHKLVFPSSKSDISEVKVFAFFILSSLKKKLNRVGSRKKTREGKVRKKIWFKQTVKALRLKTK